jgi:hypothetical protein
MIQSFHHKHMSEVSRCGKRSQRALTHCTNHNKCWQRHDLLQFTATIFLTKYSFKHNIRKVLQGPIKLTLAPHATQIQCQLVQPCTLDYVTLSGPFQSEASQTAFQILKLTSTPHCRAGSLNVCIAQQCTNIPVRLLMLNHQVHLLHSLRGFPHWSGRNTRHTNANKFSTPNKCQLLNSPNLVNSYYTATLKLNNKSSKIWQNTTNFCQICDFFQFSCLPHIKIFSKCDSLIYFFDKIMRI